MDATNGNDSNGGLSSSTAWRTIAKVNASSFNPGDQILFKRGEVWREQLVPHSGGDGNPVTYSSHGTGNLPLLLGSIGKNNTHDWTHEGGNIWSSSIAESLDVGNLIFDYENSCGIKVWNQEDLNKQGEFWYDEDNSLLKIYSQGNPASYYSNIECALRRSIIWITNKSHITIENLDLRYGGAHGIGAGNVHHIIVRSCDFSYIGGGDQFGGTERVRYGNGIEFWENAHDCTVERCRLWEIYDAALTNQGYNTNNQYNIYYRYNIIWNCEYSFEYWNRPETSVTHDIYFENNTCANAGAGWGHSQRSDPSGTHLCFFSNTAETGNICIRNNIFYEAADTVLYVSPAAWNGLDNLILDYNCWYKSSGDLINYQGDIYTAEQFSTYRTEKGKDAHSILTDPRFKDAENHNFRLFPNSPCIDVGTNVGLTHDYDGHAVPQGSEVDIGAFEYYIEPPKNLRIVSNPKHP